jgi:hypothetical protein
MPANDVCYVTPGTHLLSAVATGPCQSVVRALSPVGTTEDLSARSWLAVTMSGSWREVWPRGAIGAQTRKESGLC